MFRSPKKGREEPPLVLSVLKRLAEERRAVRMEIDAAMARFNTGILLRNHVVLVGKPAGLAASLKKGDLARFRIPWDTRNEVRMEIAVLHMNLSNGTEVFLCETPSGRALPVRRALDRFNTRSFKNLHLDLPALKESFAIVDLSASGCRLEASPTLFRHSLGVKRRIWQGKIMVGERLRINLDLVIPRAYQDKTVGLEFVVNRSGNHNRDLTTLLGLLAIREVSPEYPRPA